MNKGNESDNEMILNQYLTLKIAEIRNKMGHNGLTMTLQDWKIRGRILADHRAFAEDLVRSLDR